MWPKLECLLMRWSSPASQLKMKSSSAIFSSLRPRWGVQLHCDNPGDQANTTHDRGGLLSTSCAGTKEHTRPWRGLGFLHELSKSWSLAVAWTQPWRVPRSHRQITRTWLQQRFDASTTLGSWQQLQQKQHRYQAQVSAMLQEGTLFSIVGICLMRTLC